MSYSVGYSLPNSGTWANRPTNPPDGWIYFATDREEFYVYDRDATKYQFPQKKAIWKLPIPNTFEVGGDAYLGSLAGLDGAGDITLTEAAATLCKVYDHGTTTFADLEDSDDLTGFTNPYQLTPDAASEAINDAAYFGHSIKFGSIRIDMGTNAAWSGDGAVWEYYDGSAWQTLTVYDSTDATAQDGLRPFQQDGSISFLPPTDWTTTTIDSQSAYWIRSRITAATVTTTPLTNSKQHEYVVPTDAFIAPHYGLITGLTLFDLAATMHTTADVKFYLMNFTTGEHSKELTFAQDKRADRWASTTFSTSGLAVSPDDVLWPIVTQEDGTNEVTNAILDLIVEAE